MRSKLKEKESTIYQLFNFILNLQKTFPGDTPNALTPPLQQQQIDNATMLFLAARRPPEQI